MCKVNPGHVVGDAGLAIISVWLVPRHSPCMGAAWLGEDENKESAKKATEGTQANG